MVLFTVIEQFTELLFKQFASTALKVKLNVPSEVGVPVMNPFSFHMSPGGSPRGLGHL
jgi:hypothetical protein